MRIRPPVLAAAVRTAAAGIAASSQESDLARGAAPGQATLAGSGGGADA